MQPLIQLSTQDCVNMVDGFGGVCMQTLMRLPALPLVANDPYFSIWCAADRLPDADTTHWAGARKRLRGKLVIDGKPCRYLGHGEGEAMETVSLTVTPTSTQSVLQDHDRSYPGSGGWPKP